MHMMQRVTIIAYTTPTYNDLIIGTLTLITKKKEREGAATLLYSMHRY
jgi:hypothetical protein